VRFLSHENIMTPSRAVLATVKWELCVTGVEGPFVWYGRRQSDSTNISCEDTSDTKSTVTDTFFLFV
jgi:hypothetical protein